MPTKDDLDKALSAVVDEVAKVGTDLTKTLDDITAKAATGTDFTAEIATAQGLAASLSTIDAQAVAADPGAPVIVPPAPKPPTP